MALWSVVGLELKDKGHPYPSMDNALRIFTAELCDNGCHYDPFLNQIMVRGSSDEPHKPLTDEFILGYVLLCQRKYGIQNMRKSDMHDAINLYAKNHVFNSLTDWLTKLTWDGVSRVEAFCNLGLGSPDTEYTRGVSVCFLIGMIARAIRPGCQVDCMPVLEGLQGIGKSRALEALAGTEKFADIDAPMGSKRFSEDIQGKWLVELSELSAMRPSEIETIKSTITRTVDVYRVPWDRLSTSHPRQCVFAGTTNADAYLSDHENRRFWPIKCGNINKDWIETNREQLFAEALVMFHQGDSWWNVNQAAHNEEVQKRRILDSMQDAVDNYLSTNDGDVKVSAILESFDVPKSQWSPSLQKRVGECLKHAGYFKTVTKGLRVYRRVDSQTVVQPFRVLHAQKKAGE
jgi:predicted P-loop ATPase